MPLTRPFHQGRFQFPEGRPFARLFVFTNSRRGLAVLRKLSETSHQVLGVVVPPSAPQLVLDETHDLGLEILQPENVNDAGFIEYLKGLSLDCLVVAGFPTIFGEKLLDAIELVINLHGGPLPKYRGGSPLNWQIAQGEESIEISAIQMDSGLDTGPLLAARRFSIDSDSSIGQVQATADELFGELAAEVIQLLVHGRLRPKIQRNAKATYWHQRSDEDGRIDWRSMSSRQVHNLVRAVSYPYPGAWTLWEGRVVRVLKTSVPIESIRGTPGRVCKIRGLGTFVTCRDTAVRIVSVQRDGHEVSLPNGLRLG